MALGFVPLHIFIPAGVSAAPFINNAVGKATVVASLGRRNCGPDYNSKWPHFLQIWKNEQINIFIYGRKTAKNKK